MFRLIAGLVLPVITAIGWSLKSTTCVAAFAPGLSPKTWLMPIDRVLTVICSALLPTKPTVAALACKPNQVTPLYLPALRGSSLGLSKANAKLASPSTKPTALGLTAPASLTRPSPLVSTK